MGQLRVIGLNKRFDGVQALNDVNLELRDGGFMALLGPSGAGKTTTLKVISGVQDAEAGDIYIGDRLVNNVPAERRNTALVFENYALYPNMTVFENLAFPLRAPARATKLQGSAIEARVREVARMLEIDALLERQTWQLSGGQRQRVSLGRALVRQPDLFLMDEPISHLDAKLRFQMRAELKRLQKEVGITTLYATPDYAEALAVADVIVVLRSGVVQQVGDSDTVFNHPANRYVAHLVGEPHINFLEMRLQRQDRQLELVHDTAVVKVPPQMAGGLLRANLDGRVVVGVRPSDLHIASSGDCDIAIPATLLTVEPRGSTTVLVFESGNQQFSVKVRGERGPEPGADAWLTCDTAALHFFHPESGERVEVPETETARAGAGQ